MRKITGTVIKIIDGKAAIMTKDCEMLFIKKQPGMYLGLELQFGANEIISTKRKVDMTVKIVTSLAAIFLFVFLSLQIFYKSDDYTYICIDGVSSIEFTVDSDMNVVKATSADKRAQENLIKINVTSKSLKMALSDVLKSNNNILRDGNIKDDCIIISAYSRHNNVSGNHTNKNIEKVFTTCKNSVDESNNNVNCRFVGISNDTRNMAEKNNISMGRYYIFERAQEQGKDISLEQAKDMQVGELVKEVNIPYLSITNENETSKDDKKKPEIIKDKNSKRNDIPLPAASQDVLYAHNNTDIPNNIDNNFIPGKEVREPEKQKNQDDKDSAGHKLEVEERNTIEPDQKPEKDKNVPPTPIPPKANDIKVPPTPVAPNTHDIKAPATPIPPNTPDKKVPPTPIPPKVSDIKVLPTPIAPNIPVIKEPATAIVLNTPDIKTQTTSTDTPIIAAAKVTSTPTTQNIAEIKLKSTPIPHNIAEIKVPPLPVPPNTADLKVTPIPIDSNTTGL